MPSRLSWLLLSLALIAGAWLFALAGCGNSGSPPVSRFVGEFSAGKIVLRSEADGAGIKGTIELESSTFPFTATIHGNRASGSFQNNGTAFEFVATIGADGMLTFSTGGVSHRLARVDRTPPNPFADPSISAPLVPNPLADAQSSQPASGVQATGQPVNPLAAAAASQSSSPGPNPPAQTHAHQELTPVNPLGGTPPNPLGQPAEAAAAATVGTHRLASGLRFAFPSSFTIEAENGVAALSPKDAALRARLVVMASPKPAGVITDHQVLSSIDRGVLTELPHLRRVGDVEAVSTEGGQGVLFRYEGMTQDQGGAPVNVAAACYAAMVGDLLAQLVSYGERSAVITLEPASRLVFKSFRFEGGGGQPVNPLGGPTGTTPANPLGAGAPGGPAAQSGPGRRLNHPLGLSLEVPSDWQPAMHEGQIYFMLPGGQNAGVVYTLRADLAPDITRADDPKLIGAIETSLLNELMQSGVQGKRIGPPRPVDHSGISIAAMSHEGATGQGTLLIDTYIAVQRNLVFVLAGVGLKDRVQPTQGAANAVAKSFRFGDPALDQRLVGQWRSTRHGGSGGGYAGGISTTSENNVLLRPDGTFEQQGNFMFSTGAGSGTSEGGVSRGRWAAGEGLLFLAGKDGLASFGYALSGDAMEVRAPGGDPQLWERVR